MKLTNLALIFLILTTMSACGSDDSSLLIISSNFPAEGADPNSGGSGSSIGFVSNSKSHQLTNFKNSNSMLQIRYQDLKCLGAILDKNSILTQSECLQEVDDIRLIEFNGQIIHIKDIVPYHDSISKLNDLVVIKTAEDLNLP